MAVQHASNDVDEELSAVIQELWNADKNRLIPGKDYVIDLQDRCHMGNNMDRAAGPLFDRVEDDVLQRPTYKAFVSLLDNYESDLEAEEELTQGEIRESQRFIIECMKTKVMEVAYKYLVQNRKVPGDVKSFTERLYKMWFHLYKRDSGSRNLNSCAFKHVFAGETRGDSVIGFHNWIQFYLQEKSGNVDYHGFVKSISSNNQNLLSVKFNWKGHQAMSTFFMGTSPEFELALYSVCFLADRGEELNVKIDDWQACIKCYKFGGFLGDVYPVTPH